MFISNYELSFNSFVFIKSLEDTEAYTSTSVQEFIMGHPNNQLYPLGMSLQDVKSADDFKALIKYLCQLTRDKGMRPLLNIDCHGNKLEGLAFLDGSTLEWNEVADCLRPLNEATEFNLMVVFSCCFGAHFMGGMGVIEPAPCAFVLGPTDTIDGGEILNGLISFYGVLLETLNLVQSALQARKGNLHTGAWHAEFATSWFAEVIQGYLENYCTKAMGRERVSNIFQLYKANNQHQKHGENSMSGIKRKLSKENRESLTQKYFDKYFMLDKIPENKNKYEELRECTKSHIIKLMKTGKYYL